jgi:nucleoside-diphosphate-sugar epimerase
LKRILVTGNNGFIGKHLSRRLQEDGFEVIGFDLIDGDIAEKGTLDPLLERNISYIFHLAAKTFVPESWTDPFDFYRINVMGTLNVLEFCRAASIGLTHISSYLYGNPDYLPIDENHPLKAYNPYSQSKIIAEELVRFYSEKYGVNATILRPFNIYGPEQSTNFLVSELIEKILDPTIHEIEVMDLKPKRDYIYIDDVVEALVLSMNHPKGIYNVGSGHSVTIDEIINTIFELTGIYKSFRSKGLTRPNEIFDLYSNNQKSENELEWEPNIDLKTGLALCLKNKFKEGDR